MVKAAGVEVEPYYPGLFAKLLAKTNMDDLIGAIGAAPAPGGGGGGGGGGGDAAPAEEEDKKEEEEEEEEEDVGFRLPFFGACPSLLISRPLQPCVLLGADYHNFSFLLLLVLARVLLRWTSTYSINVPHILHSEHKDLDQLTTTTQNACAC